MGYEWLWMHARNSTKVCIACPRASDGNSSFDAEREGRTSELLENVVRWKHAQQRAAIEQPLHETLGSGEQQTPRGGGGSMGANDSEGVRGGGTHEEREREAGGGGGGGGRR